MGHNVGALSHAYPSVRQYRLRKNELTLREVNGVDEESVLAEIYVRAYADSGETWGVSDAKLMLDSLGSPEIAELNGKIVGAIYTSQKPWENGSRLLHIDEVFVDPEYQRLGIGAVLIKDAIEIGLKSGVTEVSLETFAGRPNPESWYRSMGFENPSTPELQIMTGRVNQIQERISARYSKERG